MRAEESDDSRVLPDDYLTNRFLGLGSKNVAGRPLNVRVFGIARERERHFFIVHQLCDYALHGGPCNVYLIAQVRQQDAVKV
jgi:hypothetical protein